MIQLPIQHIVPFINSRVVMFFVMGSFLFLFVQLAHADLLTLKAASEGQRHKTNFCHRIQSSCIIRSRYIWFKYRKLILYLTCTGMDGKDIPLQVETKIRCGFIYFPKIFRNCQKLIRNFCVSSETISKNLAPPLPSTTAN